MDVIWVRGIRCRVRIGVPDEERAKRQPILIDVGLELSTAEAAARDDLNLTANYWAVEKLVRQAAEAGVWRLVETLAEQLASVVLQQEKLVQAVRVAVHKKPAVMPKASEVVVEIRRGRV